MGSQDSNIGSDGLPIDQEGAPLEYGLFPGQGMPYAVAGSVLRDLVGGQDREDGAQHLEADPVRDEQIMRQVSSSGGIMVEEMAAVSNSEEDEEDEDAMDITGLFTANEAVKAAFSISKAERKELIETRHLVLELQSFMKSKGLTMAEFDKDKVDKLDSFNAGLPKFDRLVTGRDEYGLPIFSKLNEPTSSGVKNSQGKERCSGPGSATEINKQNMGNKSWRNVVQDSSSDATTKLQYFPPQQTTGGATPIIRPPKEFLLSSQKTWDNSLVGYFVGSSLPFKLVEEEAKKLWLHLGFLKMYMVKKGFYVFKFNSELDRNKILAAGPWHFKRNQIILQPWYEGIKLEKTGFSKLPLWVKIHDIPFSYWTSINGLCYVASGVGKPLQLDHITAKLDPMPYAKMLIEVDASVALPSTLNVAVLNSDGITESLIESKVEYFNKPSQCSVCHVFGHSLAKCPKRPPQANQASQPPSHPTATWVQKSPSATGGNIPPSHAIHPDGTATNHPVTSSSSVEAQMPTSSQATPSPCEFSPPIPTTGIVSKLKHVDEVGQIRGILKHPPSNSNVSGPNLKMDAEGFQTVLSKKHKKKGLSPRNSPPRNF